MGILKRWAVLLGAMTLSQCAPETEELAPKVDISFAARDGRLVSELRPGQEVGGVVVLQNYSSYTLSDIQFTVSAQNCVQVLSSPTLALAELEGRSNTALDQQEVLIFIDPGCRIGDEVQFLIEGDYTAEGEGFALNRLVSYTIAAEPDRPLPEIAYVEINQSPERRGVLQGEGFQLKLGLKNLSTRQDAKWQIAGIDVTGPLEITLHETDPVVLEAAPESTVNAALPADFQVDENAAVGDEIAVKIHIALENSSQVVLTQALRVEAGLVLERVVSYVSIHRPATTPGTPDTYKHDLELSLRNVATGTRSSGQVVLVLDPQAGASVAQGYEIGRFPTFSSGAPGRISTGQLRLITEGLSLPQVITFNWYTGDGLRGSWEVASSDIILLNL